MQVFQEGPICKTTDLAEFAESQLNELQDESVVIEELEALKDKGVSLGATQNSKVQFEGWMRIIQTKNENHGHAKSNVTFCKTVQQDLIDLEAEYLEFSEFHNRSPLCYLVSIA